MVVMVAEGQMTSDYLNDNPRSRPLEHFAPATGVSRSNHWSKLLHPLEQDAPGTGVEWSRFSSGILQHFEQKTQIFSERFAYIQFISYLCTRFYAHITNNIS